MISIWKNALNVRKKLKGSLAAAPGSFLRGPVFMPRIIKNNLLLRQALPVRVMKDVKPVHMPSNHSFRFFSYGGPVIICMGLIFYLSSIPGRKITFLFPYQDVFGHLAAYSVLGFFVMRLLKHSLSRQQVSKLVLYSALFGLVYGFSDELHQTFIPGRHFSAFDIFIDTTGSFIGSLFYR